MIESLPAIRTCSEPLITTLITLASEGPSAPMPAAPAIDARPREPERGQAMVEFAAVLLPLILVLVGILQFGFLFAAYVGVSNSAREAGRAGTIYEYDANEGAGSERPAALPGDLSWPPSNRSTSGFRGSSPGRAPR